MPFDFPNSPTEGSTYSPPNGPQYVYRGGVWRQAYGSPLKLTATTDGNPIVNGAFNISQENGDTGSAANAYFFSDQWSSHHSGAVTFGGARNWNPTIGAYSGYINPQSSGSTAAGSYGIMMQNFEGARWPLRYGSAKAIPALLNFKMQAARAGVYGAAFRRQDGTRSIVWGLDMPDAGVWKEFTLPIPPETTGTWALSTSAALNLTFSYIAGTTYKTPTEGQWVDGTFLGPSRMTENAVGGSAPMHVCDVQICPDPNNTGVAPPFVPKLYDQDLDDCRRYYQNIGHGGIYHGLVASVSSIYMNVNFPPMRVGPSISGIQANPCYGASATPTQPTSSTPVQTGNSSMRLTFGHSSTLTGIIAQSTGIILNARM